MDKVRINKYLADNGICSRRKADEHILDRKVRINDKIAELGDLIDPDTDKIFFNHILVNKQKAIEYEYWAINKPKNYISTVNDELNRPKVTDLIKSKQRLYPAGRLDAGSQGLMILTNDGDFVQELTHPSNSHTKTYSVDISFKFKDNIDQVKKVFEKGIIISNQLMKAEKVEIESINKSKKTASLKLDLCTGYNRQIRKMCDKMGLEILKLVRIRIGKLYLKNLDLQIGKAIKVNKSDIL